MSLKQEIAIKASFLGKKYQQQTRRDKTLFRHILSFLGQGPAKRPLWAVRGVSLEIKRGECLGIVGPNGSGKSTLLLLLSGILPPTEGAVEIRGRVSPFFGLGAGLYTELTVIDNIRLAGVLFGLTRQEINQKLDSIISFAEIEDYLYARLSELSSGYQARAIFSVALHAPIEIVLLDEVFAVGDALFQRKSVALMDALRKQGKTIITVSHSMEFINAYCSRAIYINKGEIQAEGKPWQVTQKYLQKQGLS